MNKKKPHRHFELQEYNPDWPNMFNQYADILKGIFKDECIDIHHVGSTSIPGMLAKPQIDILLIVRHINNVNQYQEAMQQAGFIYKGRDYVPRLEDHDYFVIDDQNGKRLAGVHVVPVGHPEAKAWLCFRDYLRTHKTDRKLYEQTKRSLFQQHHSDYHHYDVGKIDVIQEIKQRADKWCNISL